MLLMHTGLEFFGQDGQELLQRLYKLLLDVYLGPRSLTAMFLESAQRFLGPDIHFLLTLLPEALAEVLVNRLIPLLPGFLHPSLAPFFY